MHPTALRTRSAGVFGVLILALSGCASLLDYDGISYEAPDADTDAAAGGNAGATGEGGSAEDAATEEPGMDAATGGAAGTAGGAGAGTGGVAGSSGSGGTAGAGGTGSVEATVREELIKVATAEVGMCGPDARPYMLSQPDGWCYDFVAWVYEQAGNNLAMSLPAPMVLPTYQATSLPPGWIPEAGDMIKFTIQHYGMVEKSSPDASAIQTIEGNYNDCVVNNQVSLQEISYFGYLDSQLQ
jgi:hypothetical protein